MKSFDAYLASSPDLRNKTWVILGKGPSFSRFSELRKPEHLILGLNHVVCETPLDICHITDLDVVYEVDSQLELNASILLMPEYPHVSYKIPGLKGRFHRPGHSSLHVLCQQVPALRRMRAAGRLVLYRSSTHTYQDNLPVVRAGSFSASTVVSLLGGHGIKRVRTLGIDGGKAYNEAFDGLGTLLEAGQESFDCQFAEIAEARFRHEMDISPLDDEDEIVVYVGSTNEQELAFQVLKYSIERRCSRSVRVKHLGRCIKSQLPAFESYSKGVAAGTPFSLQRFAIPELQRRRGRAIYVDSDMLVLADISQLWTTPMQGNDFLSASKRPGCSRPAQFSVLLIDCGASSWDLGEIFGALKKDKRNYERIFLQGKYLGKFERSLPWQWNALEYYKENHVNLLHFTDMAAQPWLSWVNPRSKIWFGEFFDWLAEDGRHHALVRCHIKKSWVRPSIEKQIECKIQDPLLLPLAFRSRDTRHFVPPHAYLKSRWAQRMTGYGEAQPTKLQLIAYLAVANMRSLAMKLGIFELAKRFRTFFGKVRRAVSTGIGVRS